VIQGFPGGISEIGLASQEVEFVPKVSNHRSADRGFNECFGHHSTTRTPQVEKKDKGLDEDQLQSAALPSATPRPESPAAGGIARSDG
jgi:hypothetical protein